VLRDGLDLPYEQIAEMVGVSAANARQLLHRARGRVADGSARFEVDQRTRGRLVEALRNAFASGRLEPLVDLLHDDVVLVSDGGGKVRAALRPIAGAAKVFRFLTAVADTADPGLRAETGSVNGAPAMVVYSGGAPAYVLEIGVADGRITDLLLVANPDKLAFARRQGTA
jgi:RNA polymerase sigma-70 factor, ECF subfamily